MRLEEVARTPLGAASAAGRLREGALELRVLAADDLRRALDMPGAIAAMEEAFGRLSAGRATVPTRVQVRTERGTTLAMAGSLEEAGLAAKLVSVFPENRAEGLPALHGLVVVLDPLTGVPRAVMEGTWLTALRTGAASGLATRLLADEGASVLTIFGAGAQAGMQLEGVRAVRELREVRIVSRTRASAERFAAEAGARMPRGVEARAVEDRREALRGAHLVAAATTSRTPVFDGRHLETGAHVNGVGSFTPEMQEVDATTVRRARVVVDFREAALAEAGDLLVPMRQGLIGPEHIDAELGEIVNGAKPRGRAGHEVTFFKSVGVAAQDVAVAALALEAAEAEGLGILVDL